MLSRFRANIIQVLKRIYFFFPVQLLIVHLKHNLILLLFWVVLFMFTAKMWGVKMGIPLLFLDPEYLGNVDFWSYLIMGASCGAFIVAYQIASYISNSYRFPFLASLSNPFLKYTVNNAIVPLLFVLYYSYQNIRFQLNNEFLSNTDIILNLSGFYIGIFLAIAFSFTYFFTVSKDIFRLFGLERLTQTVRKRTRRIRLNKNRWTRISQMQSARDERHVETYLASPIEIRLARETYHYEREVVDAVFKQNHVTAAVFEIFVIFLLIFLGFFSDFEFAMIPAAASIFLALTMLLMLASAVQAWLKQWSIPFFLVVIFAINYLSGYEFLGKRSHAFGLNYAIDAAQIPDSVLFDQTRRLQYNADVNHGLEELGHWKRKSHKGRSGKPAIIFIATSGGGLKSAAWTFTVMQNLDSLLDARFMQNVQMITGSSGGLIGASYFRELYYQKQLGKDIDLNNQLYYHKITQDMLNPVGFTLAVNDIFLRFKSFHLDGQRYTKDRGYAFEQALNRNTDFALNKRMMDYALAEYYAHIPKIIFTPTIINDGRRMIISSLPSSYLTYSISHTFKNQWILPEDVEFRRFFAQHGADSLLFTSAIRMSATFPYILPAVALPSEPLIEVMDAGFRDNYGIKTVVRYIHAFRNWLQNNTSSIVILQIRENHKAFDLKTKPKRTITELLTSPLGNVYENMFRIQDYVNDQLVQYAEYWYRGKIELVEFDLNPDFRLEENISMNLHLTSKEKLKIREAIKFKENRDAVERLRRLLNQ
ncbi:MAG: patatin-like phospholipase family protein [Flavobacteriales bacterium]